MADPVQDLVLRAQQRDADAFAMLIDRYEKAALAVAYGVLRDADLAGDAVQEAFLRAWTELGRLQEAARFGGWVMQIVRNAALDLRRKRKVSVGEFPDLAAETPGPGERGERQERDARIREALDGLDETTRTAVMMRYYDGLSAKEIGELLSLSSAAVDMRLSRGRAVLKERLGSLLNVDEPASVGRADQKGA